MLLKRSYVLIGLMGAVLGFFVAQQFFLHARITKTVQPDNENNLALEVSALIKTNTDLKQEVDDLSSQHDKLSRQGQDAKSANDTLEQNLTNYKIILGLTKVSGEGVEVKFDNKLNSTELIDLLNAIKNIGAEAISVNDQRLVINTSISSGLLEPPTSIKVIGDKNILYESLVRAGGILEQIGFGKVEKQDNIEISAAK